MRTTDKNAIEIADQGGAIASSDWTTGSGRYISKRPIPNLCAEIYADDVESLVGKSKTAAMKLLKSRPRVQKIIFVSNWRKLNKMIKKND